MRIVNIRMMAVFFLSLISLYGCEKEKDNLKHDEYFIKYEIQSSSLPYYGVKLNITKSNESSQNVQEIINTGNWERTIGPVKKGYVANLKAVKSNWDGKPEYHLKMTLSISVSKNGMPFTQRKIDNNENKPRASASIQYIVD